MLRFSCDFDGGCATCYALILDVSLSTFEVITTLPLNGLLVSISWLTNNLNLLETNPNLCGNSADLNQIACYRIWYLFWKLVDVVKMAICVYLFLSL